MSSTELLPQIFSLSRQEQVRIAEAIRDHLYGDLSSSTGEELKREMEERSAHARTHPEEDMPHDEVMKRLRKGR